MFKNIELEGTSEKGYSDAVRDALGKVEWSVKKVFYFEVIEQGGIYEDRALKKFKVKLKVFIDEQREKTEINQSDKHICPTCNKETGEDGHMCSLTGKMDSKCKYCGLVQVDEKHLCSDKIKEISHTCEYCGRVAINESLLCHPKKIE